MWVLCSLLFSVFPVFFWSIPLVQVDLTHSFPLLQSIYSINKPQFAICSSTERWSSCLHTHTSFTERELRTSKKKESILEYPLNYSTVEMKQRTAEIRHLYLHSHVYIYLYISIDGILICMNGALNTLVQVFLCTRGRVPTSTADTEPCKCWVRGYTHLQPHQDLSNCFPK